MKDLPTTASNKKLKDILIDFFPALPTHDFRDYQMLELQLSRHVLEITLTKAEVLLFELGFANGELLLDDSTQELNTNNILRSEILDWYLTLPSKYTFLFRKGQIRIAHGMIITMKQFIDFQLTGAIAENADVINLSNKAIAINIEFVNCVFKGSVNIANSEFNNLTFTRCVFGKGKIHLEPFTDIPIYPSIYANQTRFTGNFKLVGFDDASQKDYKSDFAGPIVLTNATVQKSFSISSIQTSHDIICYFSSFGVVVFWNSKVIFASLQFTHAEAKELYLQKCTLFGPLDNGDGDDKKAAASFFAFKAERFCVRATTTVIGGFSAEGMNISGMIDIDEAIFISRAKAGMAQNNEIDKSIDLSNTNAKVLYLRNGFVSFGCSALQSISAQNVVLARSRFLNFSQNNYGKSLVMSGASILNFVDFKPESVITSPCRFMTFSDIKAHLESLVPVLPETLITYPNLKSSIEFCLNTTGVFDKLEEIETKIIGKIADSDIIAEYTSSNKVAHLLKRIYLHRTKTEKLSRLKSFRRHQTERLRQQLIDYYALFIGEADLSSVFVKKKVDLAGALFYGREHDKCSKHYLKQLDHNAVSLKYSQIEGDLFINDCDNLLHVPSFKAIGEVDLHSARVNQFFVNPLRGKDSDTDWRATGFKYEYIYSGGSKNARILDNCDWFRDYLSQDNYLQPYQQLAATFDRLGDDSRAKRILIRARLRIALRNPLKKFPELILYTIISVFAKLGMPASRAMIVISILFLAGAFGIDYYVNKGAFLYSDTNHIVSHVNQYLYSFENMIPFNMSIDEAFVPNYEIEIGNNAASFLLWHKLLSTTFLALLLLGISKITKGEK